MYIQRYYPILYTCRNIGKLIKNKKFILHHVLSRVPSCTVHTKTRKQNVCELLKETSSLKYRGGEFKCESFKRLKRRR